MEMNNPKKIVDELKENSLRYFNQNEFNMSLKYIREIEKVNKLDSNDYYLMGLIYEVLKQVDEAKNCFYMSLKRAPKNKKKLEKFINYMESNNLEEELQVKLERIVSLKFSLAIEIQIFLINYYFKIKQYDKSLKIALEANLIHPENISVLKKIIKIYEKKKEYKKGLFLSNKLVKLSEKDFESNMILANMKLKNGIEENPPAENIYKFLSVPSENNYFETLTIIFSSIKGKFLIKNYPFKSDKLFIAELKMTSYTYSFENLKNYLSEYISKGGYKKVNLVGSSKGGFAAINMGVALSKEMEEVYFKIASFSPQTQLYPFNENIAHLPSYVVLNKLAKNNISVLSDLKKYGNLNNISTSISKNIKVSVIYGDSHAKDVIECLRIKENSFIEYTPVPNYPLHSTLLIFTKKGDELVKAMTTRFSSKIKTDDDFFTPDNVDDFTSDFLNSIDRYKYDLNDYLIF